MTVPVDTVTPVIISVNTSLWMVIGQHVIIGQGGGVVLTNPGPATFIVDTIPGPTSVGLLWRDQPGDVGAGTQIDQGAIVSPAGSEIGSPVPVADGGTGSITATAARAALGILGTPLSVYASGTAYQLTNTAALLNFGTTDPSLIISSPGTWLILAQARIDYTGATFAAVRNVTLKLRRTNNTAADIANSPAGFKTDIITTLTYTAQLVKIPALVYVTTNSDDVLEVWGSIDTVPTAGSIDAVEASLVAVKLFDQTI
jgi:hypothetical protein